MTLSPDDLDLSMFSAEDMVNIVLQRSEVLGRNRAGFDRVRAWEAGDSGPLEAAVAENGDALTRDAAGRILSEYRALEGLLRRLAPRRMADIGSGYAMFDLFAFHALDCDLLLIDIEESENRHFGFENTGAGYSSLEIAVDFLVANGVPRGRIETWNPNRDELPEGPPIDLAVSFLSCGFHYPIDMYMPFFHYAVAEKGAVILDLRGPSETEMRARLGQLGKVRDLLPINGARRVLLKKGVQ